MKAERLNGVARRIQLQKAEEDERAHQDRCDRKIDDSEITVAKNEEEYDKQLLTLSSGFLLLSLAFVRDIVHTDRAVYCGLLYGSFISLAVCVLLVLASYQVSNLGQYKARNYWREQKGEDRTRPFPYVYATIIWVFNIAAGTVFFIGIILCTTFVIINIHREIGMSENRIPPPSDVVKKGAPVKVPPPPPKQQTPTQPSPKK